METNYKWNDRRRQNFYLIKRRKKKRNILSVPLLLFLSGREWRKGRSIRTAAAAAYRCMLNMSVQGLTNIVQWELSFILSSLQQDDFITVLSYVNSLISFYSIHLWTTHLSCPSRMHTNEVPCSNSQTFSLSLSARNEEQQQQRPSSINQSTRWQHIS